MTIGKAGSGQNLGFFSKKDFHFPFTTLKFQHLQISLTITILQLILPQTSHQEKEKLVKFSWPWSF
jgi:hypothetical protein